MLYAYFHLIITITVHVEEILWLNIEAVQETLQKTPKEHLKLEGKVVRQAVVISNMIVRELPQRVRKVARTDIKVRDNPNNIARNQRSHFQ